MTLSHLLLYVAAAFLLAITPGPGIFYVAARSLAGGRSEGIASSLGTGLGGMVHVVAGACGVSAIVLASADLFSVLKWIGAAYLVYLGIRALWAARREATDDFALGAPEPSNGPAKAFREGILVEALNPKTAAFFLAFIPQFVDPAAGPIALQFLLLGCIVVALNMLVDTTVAFAAGRLSQGATARPGLMRRLRQASGGAMIALGLGLAFARRPAV